ncbi:MAG: N-formylglutamate amidohydrolase [Methanoregulaceae archaeon]|nr:N-formylglutamate amidohydrolase [Methanoregulaceae archaeon]
MVSRYPFLLTIPHGGIAVPPEVSGMLALSSGEITYYSDPATATLYHFQDRVAATLEAGVSRMVVDLNRPPYHLPPRYPDGVVKSRTVHGADIYRELPDITLVHQLLMAHYFPFHAGIDRILGTGEIGLALDCHSMLPSGPPTHPDAGKPRPAVCLSNNGDPEGKRRPGTLSTCPADLITALAGSFREQLPAGSVVLITHPFTGGFIINAHYWHMGVPFVQVEVNRGLYETGSGPGDSVVDIVRAEKTRALIWQALAAFWDGYE